MSASGNQKCDHVALLPSAGMGHLTPFLRLAALLTVHGVRVSFITPLPTVSLAESQALSRLFTSFPEISEKQLHLLPLDEQPENSHDPFYHHFQVIQQHSSHLLPPLFSSLSPPLSAVITDMSLAATVIPITQALNLTNFIFFTSSAKMLTLFLFFHTLADLDDGTDAINIPSIGLIPKSWFPPPLLLNTNNFLKTSFIENGKKIPESSGILVNTFDSLEQETIRKLNDGKVIERLPPVIPIGPLAPYKPEKNQLRAWLESQQAGSVVYASFGSRTAMSREQLRELGDGLVRSGIRFIWVVKDKKVDRDDHDGLDEVIGRGLTEEVKEKGLVVKEWLSQEDILEHPAIGGFLSHCGWNSATEAIWYGVPILAWPQHGDQKINADVVEKIGVGMWVKSWEWGGETVVNGAEIAEKVRKMMENESLRVQAMHFREEARRAVAVGGSSTKGLSALIHMWKDS